MKRRDFLKAMLACATAPAIVKANNIMRINPNIIVPSQDIILDIESYDINDSGFRVNSNTKEIYYVGAEDNAVTVQELYKYLQDEYRGSSILKDNHIEISDGYNVGYDTAKYFKV